MDNNLEWRFNPLKLFKNMPELCMFIIGVTEQCNLRCRYCCYSGEYLGKRSHGFSNITFKEIDSIIKFIESIAKRKTKRIAFYGGEPIINFDVIKYCVICCQEKWGNDVSFSISTNGVLLKPRIINWLMEHNVEIAISLDGGRIFHDKNRIDCNGKGTFERIRYSLDYIYKNYQDPNISLHVTLANVRDIIKVAEEWHSDELLRKLSPTTIHGLTPNFAKGVSQIEYKEVKIFYKELINTYQNHKDWMVLKVFLEEVISIWKERLIFNVDKSVDMSTCLPTNTKIYIDSNLELAVCEKFSDDYRIGTVQHGVNWSKANHIVEKFYEIKKNKCVYCPAVRVCNLCLTAVEYTAEQWEILCNNEQVYARVSFFTFCEMAERDLIK